MIALGPERKQGATRKKPAPKLPGQPTSTSKSPARGAPYSSEVTLGPGAVLVRLLGLPGVVIHEFAHYFFCRLAGSRVHEAVFFSFGNPAGYVVHTVPSHVRQHVLIVLGPFLVNTSIAYTLFRLLSDVLGRAGPAMVVSDSATLAQTLIALWLAISVAIQAIPSRTDIDSLYSIIHHKLGRRQYLAGLGLLVAAPFYLANRLRPIWIEWIFAASIAAVALLPQRPAIEAVLQPLWK